MEDNVNDNSSVDESAEEVVTSEAPEADRYKNLQAEMTRKLENTTKAMQEQNSRFEQMLQGILQQQQQQATSAPAPNGKALKDLVFDDPEAFVKQVTEQARQGARAEIDQTVRASSANQAVISELQSKYAEFSQPNSEAVNLALQEAAKLPNHLKNTPEGTRLAMMNVVANMGLSPISKRAPSNKDDFALGAGSSSPSRRQADPKKDIDPSTLAFAELIGIDISDPKRLESLKKSSGRKNWNKYE